MSTTILMKTSSKGQQIEVRLKEYLPGAHIAQLFIDGQYVTGPSEPQALKQPKGEVTHFLGGGFSGGKPAVGFTATEAAQINEAIQAANAAWRAGEAGQEQRLLSERERLVATVQGLTEDAEAAFETRHAEEDTDGAYRARAEYATRIEAAHKTLTDFDQAHPEVWMAHAAARIEAAERFERTN